MLIEAIINGKVVDQEKLKDPAGFGPDAHRIRKEVIDFYVKHMARKHPTASFQVTFPSRMNKRLIAG